ncbi:MAG: heme-binding domain-containing protein [Bacteroidetes bacterium]|nr:heme-binding domain-containing protein [Bacteroidota bacterium]
MSPTNKWIIFAVVTLTVLIYTEPEKTNPLTIENEIIYNTTLTMPDTVKKLLRSSCFDCHSNETKWVWYTYIPIASHFTGNHVQEGRKHLNFSKWGSYKIGRKLNKLAEIKEMVESHEMPINNYLWLHPEADLTDDQRRLIIDWAIKEVDTLAIITK